MENWWDKKSSFLHFLTFVVQFVSSSAILEPDFELKIIAKSSGTETYSNSAYSNPFEYKIHLQGWMKNFTLQLTQKTSDKKRLRNTWKLNEKSLDLLMMPHPRQWCNFAYSNIRTPKAPSTQFNSVRFSNSFLTTTSLAQSVSASIEEFPKGEWGNVNELNHNLIYLCRIRWRFSRLPWVNSSMSVGSNWEIRQNRANEIG